MRLLTLNLHCFAEKDVPRNQAQIASMIDQLDLDVVFLQEVAQSEKGISVTDTLKEDNYGLILQKLLAEKGKTYYYHYMYGNIAFSVYQEGLGILSKTPLFDETHFFISKNTDYYDWHTRVIVSAKTIYNNTEFQLCSAHLGWTEGEEKFEDQMDRLLQNLEGDNVLLAGDFNVGSMSEEYKYIVQKGVYDLYYGDDKNYFLVPTHISDLDIHDGENRIDYIFGSKKYHIIDRKILFNTHRVSDHYGVYIEIEVE